MRVGPEAGISYLFLLAEGRDAGPQLVRHVGIRHQRVLEVVVVWDLRRDENNRRQAIA